MNFEDLANLALGWREALLGAVALLVLYVLFSFLRLRRIRAIVKPEVSPRAPSMSASAEPGVVPAPAPEPEKLGSADFSFPWNEPPQPEEQSGDERIATLEKQLNQMREDLSALRAEVMVVREETRQRVERVQAAQNVAPIYGDAMQLAMAGYDATAIAERCGVARAEAELVVALIRNSTNAPTMRER